MVLTQAVESSAGDPTQADKIRSEFAQKQGKLNQLRYEAVAKIGRGLHPDISRVLSKA